MTGERLPHLALPRLELAAPRRRRGGGGGTRPRENPQEHGTRLAREVEVVQGELRRRVDDRLLGVDPRLVFMIQLGEGYSLDEASIDDLGVHVLASDGRRHLVVFPDDVDVTRLRNRVALYTSSGGDRYKDTAAIEAIRPLGPQDRIGRRLAAAPLMTGERAGLDVELWHSGNQAEMGDLVHQLAQRLRPEGAVTDRWVGTSICLLRVRTTQAVLDILLNLDHVKEVDRRAAPTFDLLDLAAVPIDAIDMVTPPGRDAPGVVVVDSGIAVGHPLLGAVVAESRTYVTGDVAGGPSHGHGTWVAGIAAYGDVATQLARRRFETAVTLYSAKVMQSGSEYDPEVLVETQLRSLVDELSTAHPNIRVFNLSLGDPRTPYVDGGLQFRLAAAIDEIAYEYRDREIVFVISTGNSVPPADAEEALSTYPDYLYRDAARLIDPATSLLGITVGGLSAGEARQLEWREDNVDRGVAEWSWPSPFTRTGPGHAGSIKPDVVEFAGDARFVMGRLAAEPGGSGLATTSDQFAPPRGELFKTVAGTSFAAPKVAHLAALLFREFDGASSNLVRALIADSARIPADRPPLLAALAEHDPRIHRTYGYGVPDFDRAASSRTNRVLLLADELMPVDHVYLYEIPELPDNFRSAQGRGRISVTLAYDPPTRHTRSTEYQGVRMQFALCRNTGAAAVYDAIRAWDAAEADDLEGSLPGLGGISTVALYPGTRLRNLGTLQRGVGSIDTTAWRYDGRPLVLAVTCQRRWAPATIDRQRFALVVSVEHENDDVDLYAALQIRTRAYQQVRVRLTG